MTPALRFLYIGAALLSAVALALGTYDYIMATDESRSLVSDVLIPLGALVVIVFLYRRRKADLEGDFPLR